MGPRPRGRGVVEQRDDYLKALKASMGPRPRGRGVPVREFQAWTGLLSFNGAAPARARSLPCQGAGISPDRAASMGPRPRGRGVAAQRPVTTVLLRRFNGAAPARARSFGDACWPWPKAKMLQWGRARAGAELVTRSPFCS